MMLVYFYNMGFPFFCRYIHFFKQTAAMLYFCHFPYKIRVLLNIDLILFAVHYFDAESSEKKNNCHRQNAQNYLFFRKQMAAILYFVIFPYIISFYYYSSNFDSCPLFRCRSQVKKINCYGQNAQNYILFKNRLRPFCICLSPKLCAF